MIDVDYFMGERELARRLGISRQRINQLQRSAIRRLWLAPIRYRQHGLYEEFIAAVRECGNDDCDAKKAA